jgi:hypothetical protein
MPPQGANASGSAHAAVYVLYVQKNPGQIKEYPLADD